MANIAKIINPESQGNYGDHTEVWVKARNTDEAIEAANANGIPYRWIVRVYDCKPGEMVMLTVRGYYTTVMEWFLKPGQAPYPWGSCMLYRGEGN
jgi:hypothetical protein